MADVKANQAEDEKDNGAIQKMMDVQTASNVEMENEGADLEPKTQDAQEAQEEKFNDLSAGNVERITKELLVLAPSTFKIEVVVPRT